MKKLMTTLVALAVTIAAQASQDTLRLGYCNGVAGSNPGIQQSGEGWTECAIRLKRPQLAAYAQCRVAGVRAALAARNNTDTLRVWVRKNLDGPDLASASVVRSGMSGIYTGWNTLLFDAPYTLAADEAELYVGYSLHQKSAVKAVAMTSREVPEASFVRIGSGSWIDISANGTLSVEALVAGESLPDTDLGIADVSVEPLLADGSTAMRATARVHNFGRKAVPGFTVGMNTDGGAEASAYIDAAVESQTDTVVTFTFDPAAATGEDTRWSATLTASGTMPDGCAANDTATAAYSIARNVVIEEFTTELCHNCPTMAGYLHTVLADAANAGRVFAVAHHAGFQTDWLTLDGDEDLLWLYNGSTYAPATAINRRPVFAARDNGDALSAVGAPGSADELAACTAAEKREPASAKISLKLSLNADSTQLGVDVYGICTAAYATPNPHVTVCLVENGIAAKSQVGADGTFVHQHVVRANNGTWGEPVEWADRRMHYATTFTLDRAWAKQNLEVVAFVGNYDSADPTACITDNAAMATLATGGDATAIAAPKASETAREAARYDLAGRRVARGTRGIAIVKMTDGTRRKTVM